MPPSITRLRMRARRPDRATDRPTGGDEDAPGYRGRVVRACSCSCSWPPDARDGRALLPDVRDGRARPGSVARGVRPTRVAALPYPIGATAAGAPPVTSFGPYRPGYAPGDWYAGGRVSGPGARDDSPGRGASRTLGRRMRQEEPDLRRRSGVRPGRIRVSRRMRRRKPGPARAGEPGWRGPANRPAFDPPVSTPGARIGLIV